MAPPGAKLPLPSSVTVAATATAWSGPASAVGTWGSKNAQAPVEKATRAAVQRVRAVERIVASIGGGPS